MDADNLATAVKVGPGAVLGIRFAITNNGPEALDTVRFTDLTLEGPEVTDIAFTLVRPIEGVYQVVELSKSEGGYFITGDGGMLVLAPGERIGGRGILAGLAPDETLPHGNRASVYGYGEVSRIPVADDDEFWAVDPPLAWTRAIAFTPTGDQRDVRGSSDQGVAVIGDQIGDTIYLGADMPAGSTATVRLFHTEPGLTPSGDDQLLWESPEPIAAQPGGQVTTGAVHTVDEIGIFHFHLRVYGPDGSVFYTAEFGNLAQRIYVVNITTQAGWEDRDNNGVAGVGDWFYDRILAIGHLPEGVSVSKSATAWRVPNTHVQWTSEPAATDAPIAGIGLLPGAHEASQNLGSFEVPAGEVLFPGISATGGFTLTAYDAFGLGALTWTQHSVITGADGTTSIEVGTEFGDLHQTIAPVNHVSGAGPGVCQVFGVSG